MWCHVGELGSFSLVACTVAAPDVKCVYVSIGRSDEELQATLEVLKAHKVMANTAVVSAPPGASVGESLAAIHAACSIGGKAGQVEVKSSVGGSAGLAAVC